MRVASLDQHIRLGTDNEKSGAEGKNEESLKIDVASVHDIEGARLWHCLLYTSVLGLESVELLLHCH